MISKVTEVMLGRFHKADTDMHTPDFHCQRNDSAKITFRFFQDYFEYSISDENKATKNGFNARYESLSGSDEYQTFRPKNRLFPLIFTCTAAFPLMETICRPSISPTSLMAIFLINMAVCILICLSSILIRYILVSDYTVISANGRKLLVVNGSRRDAIVGELQERRASALGRLVAISPLAEPWLEVKKFKFLKDEGIISNEEFTQYRATILGLEGDHAATRHSDATHRIMH